MHVAVMCTLGILVARPHPTQSILREHFAFIVTTSSARGLSLLRLSDISHLPAMSDRDVSLTKCLLPRLLMCTSQVILLTLRPLCELDLGPRQVGRRSYRWYPWAVTQERRDGAISLASLMPASDFASTLFSQQNCCKATKLFGPARLHVF